MAHDPWHFPRGELASHLLKALTVIDLIAIFAPRRKGKTWFMLRDLTPLAIKKGYFPVYASLWRTPNKPHAAIAKALESAQTALKSEHMDWSSYLANLASVSINVAGVGGGSIALSRPTPATDDELHDMGALLANVVDIAKDREWPVLLMIDEAQHLATRRTFDAVAKSLRTSLEGLRATQYGQIKAIFTGSSRTDLATLLEHKNAAFYHSFDRQELPDFGRDYTDFVADQLERLGRVIVDPDELWRAFRELESSPYYMTQIINELMLKRAADLQGAKQTVLAKIQDNPEAEARWIALNALEKAVFMQVTEASAIYGNDSIRRIEQTSGVENVTVAKVQNAIRQLKKRGYIGAGYERGEYRIEDIELKAWIKTNSTTAP